MEIAHLSHVQLAQKSGCLAYSVHVKTCKIAKKGPVKERNFCTWTFGCINWTTSSHMLFAYINLPSCNDSSATTSLRVMHPVPDVQNHNTTNVCWKVDACASFVRISVIQPKVISTDDISHPYEQNSHSNI